MRKLIYILLFIFSLLSVLFLGKTSIKAQETGQGQKSEPSSGTTDSVIAPDYFPLPQPEPGFLGQDHNYSVVFRGNGEAVVSAKIVFTNKNESNLSEIKLRVPRVAPREISVYQVILQKRCIRYEPGVYNPLTRNYGPQTCVEYEEPSYYYDYWGGSKYQKAKADLDIDTLKITLPNPVATDKSGAFFVYFRAGGYTKKDLAGAFNFTFETLKAEENIRNIRIGISTDSDLFIKGASGEVAYRLQDATVESFGKAGAAAPVASAAFDSYVNQIGQGSVVKTASNLAPLESYTVKGTYADSRVKLFGREIMITVVTILVIGVFLLSVIRLIFKRYKTGLKGEKSQPSISSSSQSILVSLGVSFASSILILFYTIFVYFLGSFLQKSISYQFNTFITLFLILISFVIYSLILFAPGVYLGIKKGIGWGIGTIVLTLFWLILYFIVAIFVVFFFFGSDYYPGPVMPMMTR